MMMFLQNQQTKELQKLPEEYRVASNGNIADLIDLLIDIQNTYIHENVIYRLTEREENE